MNEYRAKSASGVFRAAIVCGIFAAAAMLTGCTTVDPQKDTLRKNFAPRWETNEVPYKDAPRQEQIGRDIRDGFTGVIDNIFEGAYSVFTIGPTTGFLIQKMGTGLGDVFGLLDDNEYTEHVFKGILSRQFLKFGAGARTFAPTMSGIHVTTFNAPEHQTLDYVGDEMFHTKVYGAPSSIVTLGAVIGSDFLVRPAGNFVRMFGGHETGETIDKFGLDMIQFGLECPFF